MSGPLATPDDVADMWRPLTSDEEPRIQRLIDKASALLRQKVPWLDTRVARFLADPADLGGLDPMVVADVTATIVKRFVVNPDGSTNTSESVGPFTQSKGFALRGDKDVRGEMLVTETDLTKLSPAVHTRARLGVIKAKPGLAPGRSLAQSPAGIDALVAMDDSSYAIGNGLLTEGDLGA